MTYDSGMTVRLPPELRQRLERLADSAGVKSSVLIRAAVNQYVAEAEDSGRVQLILEHTRKPRKKSA